MLQNGLLPHESVCRCRYTGEHVIVWYRWIKAAVSAAHCLTPIWFIHIFETWECCNFNIIMSSFFLFGWIVHCGSYLYGSQTSLVKMKERTKSAFRLMCNGADSHALLWPNYHYIQREIKNRVECKQRGVIHLIPPSLVMWLQTCLATVYHHVWTPISLITSGFTTTESINFKLTFDHFGQCITNIVHWVRDCVVFSCCFIFLFFARHFPLAVWIHKIIKHM